MPGYSSGGGYRAPNYTGGVSDYDQVSSQIPIWGWLDGSRGRVQSDEDRRAEDRNRAYWDELRAPSADQLRGDPMLRDAQLSALDRMSEWGNGGLTDADRSMLEASRGRDMQAARASREALQQQAQARGIGGSGLDFAMQQQANEGAAQRSSDRESQMMATAQDRALRATQQQAQIGSGVREQDSGDVQTAFDAASTRAAGATGQYGTDTSARQRARDRQQQADDSLAGFVEGLLT